MEIKFTHEYDQSLYEKAKMKYEKMLTTDTGKKFFVHLVKAFVQSDTNRLVESTDDLSGLVICDLTKTRLVTKNSFEAFKNNYKIKSEGFLRFENETDEAYEARKDSYIKAFKTSNPYACNAAMAYTADKTDKILCIEAIQALIDMFNEVNSNPEYADVAKTLNFVPKKKVAKNQKGDKKFTKGKYNKREPKGTLSDNPELLKLKGKFK